MSERVHHQGIGSIGRTRTTTARRERIYRTCECGETAHDRMGDHHYACRNCGARIQIVDPLDGRGVSAGKGWRWEITVIGERRPLACIRAPHIDIAEEWASTDLGGAYVIAARVCSTRRAAGRFARST